MSGHVIRDLLHELFEKDKNEALPSFYLFEITSVINSVERDHEYDVLFISYTDEI